VNIGTGAIDVKDTIAAINSPRVFCSQPTFMTSISNNKIAIVSKNEDLNNNKKISIYHTSSSTLDHEFFADALAPKFSPGNDYFAYLTKEVDQGDRPALVLMDLNYYESKRFTFEEYGENVLNYSWSPDGSKIALYAWSDINYPKLLVIDVASENIDEVTIEDQILIDGEQIHWLCPDWNEDSDKVVTLVRVGTQNRIITADMMGVTEALYGDLKSICRPTWRK